MNLRIIKRKLLKAGRCVFNILRRLINNELISSVKLHYRTLTYNEFNSWEVILETVLNPFILLINNFSHVIGVIMVFLVCIVVSSVIFIFYICLLPQRFYESLLWTVFHLSFGHWLLVNIVFHYFKAVCTDPGIVPHHLDQVASICRNCIAPRPPRSHHCNVCNRCVLKMDHHCPWLNNCVGLRNHRHFFLFMVYLWTASLYVCFKAYPEFKRHFYGEMSMDEMPFPAPLYFPNILWMVAKEKELLEKNSVSISSNIAQKGGPALASSWFHFLVCYEYMLTSTVTFVLSFLILYHARLISRGETSIESHLNKKAQLRLSKRGLLYKNPYDFGFKQNWLKFLGLHARDRSIFWHLLLPSNQPPDSNGLTFDTTLLDVDQVIRLLDV